MKKLSVSLLALAAALIAAPAAHADQNVGWYVGAGVGGTLPIDSDLHTPSGKFNGRMEDANLDLLGNVGYEWANGWRVEGEYFHNQNNVNHVASMNGSGHLSNNIAFANAIYSFKNYTRYTPYVGGGVGVDFVNVKGVGSGGVGYLTGDTTNFAYQGIAGVSTQLDPHWSASLDYRYIASTDPKVNSTAGGQGRMENASHNIIAGLRYSFGVPTPAVAAPMRTASAPVVTQRAAEKPAVAPMAPDFMVFFDFNKSVLTPEAKQIIASAAEEYKRNGYAAISITGHTDTVGSVSYNDKLSEQRSWAVEAELKRLGVETSHIKASGVGKQGLLVPTADGVREAQNRRAEITLSK